MRSRALLRLNQALQDQAGTASTCCTLAPPGNAARFVLCSWILDDRIGFRSCSRATEPLEPLTAAHRDELANAAADGRLWELGFTTIPKPGQTGAYVEDALKGQEAGHMLPRAVRELTTGAIVGSTRYHDIAAQIGRVEICYTWYAARWQRSHVNAACKLLLLAHALDGLGCQVVGLRTDNFNFASQRAIAALGARNDGVIRHHQGATGRCVTQ